MSILERNIRFFRLLGGMVLFVALVVAARANLRAADATKIAVVACPQLTASAEQAITCDSRWHKFTNLQSKAKSRVTMPTDVIDTLNSPQAIAVGESWELSDRACALLSRTIGGSLQFTSADTEAFQHWTGAAAAGVITGNGKLTVKLVESKIVQGVPQLKVQIRGELGWTDVGATPSRFGPNSWSITYRLPTSGEVVINGETGEILSLQLSSEGAVEGSWGNTNPKLEEPFKGTVVLELKSLPPITPAVRKEVEEWVRQLSSDEFSKREDAQRELTKMGDSIRPLLQSKLRTTFDAEVKFRLQELLRQLPSVDE